MPNALSNWSLIIFIIVFLGYSCQFEAPSTSVKKVKKQETITDTVLLNSSSAAQPPIAAYVFNGIKRGSKTTLYCPFFGDTLVQQFLASKAPKLSLQKIPGYDDFAIGKKVWIVKLGRQQMYERLPIIQVPESIPFEIDSIQLVQGNYRFNGGDVALEVSFENPLPEGIGWFLLTTKKQAAKTWHIEKEKARLFKQCPDRIKDFQFSEARPLTDLNGDGYPEFYFPFSDSNEGYLKSICEESKAINILFSSGF